MSSVPPVALFLLLSLLASCSGHGSSIYASYPKDLTKGYTAPSSSGTIKSYTGPSSTSVARPSSSSSAYSSSSSTSSSSSSSPSTGRIPCKLHHPQGPQFFLPRPAPSPSHAVLRSVYAPSPAATTVYWISSPSSLVDPAPALVHAVDPATRAADYAKAFYRPVLDSGSSFAELPYYQQTAAHVAGGFELPGELTWVGQGWAGGLAK